jgi:hypothetical protein
VSKDWRRREERRHEAEVEWEAARDRQAKRQAEHRAQYAEVADRLKELDIDPADLRDYLAGLER